MNKVKRIVPWIIMLLGTSLFALMLVQFMSSDVKKHQVFMEQSEDKSDMQNVGKL